MSQRNHYYFILTLALYVLIVPRPAHAYLDAGTGSYLIQVVIAFVAGGLFMLKTFWRKVWLLFKRSKKSTATPSSSSPAEKSENSKAE